MIYSTFKNQRGTSFSRTFEIPTLTKCKSCIHNDLKKKKLSIRSESKEGIESNSHRSRKSRMKRKTRALGESSQYLSFAKRNDIGEEFQTSLLFSPSYGEKSLPRTLILHIAFAASSLSFRIYQRVPVISHIGSNHSRILWNSLFFFLWGITCSYMRFVTGFYIGEYYARGRKKNKAAH